jgi:hypothetical protein
MTRGTGELAKQQLFERAPCRFDPYRGENRSELAFGRAFTRKAGFPARTRFPEDG